MDTWSLDDILVIKATRWIMGIYIHYIHTIPYHTIPYHTILYLTMPYRTCYTYHTYVRTYVRTYIHSHYQSLMDKWLMYVDVLWAHFGSSVWCFWKFATDLTFRMKDVDFLGGGTSFPWQHVFLFIPVVPHLVRWRKFQNRKPIGEVGCCESRMAEQIHWLTERWLHLSLLEWLQWLQWSPHPQLLDVVWCTAAVVVV